MINIHSLNKKDIPFMEEILKDDDMDLNEKKLKAFIKDKNAYGFVVYYENKIVGFAYAYSLMRPDDKGNMFYLHSIGILPEYQEQKLGTKLMEYIVNIAKETNHSEIFVITDEANTRACKLYKHFEMHNDFEDEIVYVRDFNDK